MNKLGKLPLLHQPGERFTYGSNADVLGYLIEVISKMSLDQFLNARLFKPLGMEDTYFYLPPSKYSRLVNVYTKEKDHLRKWKEKDWPYVSINYPTAKGTYFSGGGWTQFNRQGLCNLFTDAFKWWPVQRTTNIVKTYH